MSQLKVALKHAQIAKNGQPNNASVISHFDEVKRKHDEVLAEQEERKRKEEIDAKDTPAAPEAQEERKGPMSMEEKMRSRVRINTEEETKGVPKESHQQPAAPVQQPQPQAQPQYEPNFQAQVPNMQQPMDGDRMK